MDCSIMESGVAVDQENGIKKAVVLQKQIKSVVHGKVRTQLSILSVHYYPFFSVDSGYESRQPSFRDSTLGTRHTKQRPGTYTVTVE